MYVRTADAKYTGSSSRRWPITSGTLAYNPERSSEALVRTYGATGAKPSAFNDAYYGLYDVSMWTDRRD
jgi:hypothetical protein